MAAQSGAGAPPTARWLEPYPHLRRDRRRWQIGPVVEALEGRLVLAGISPTIPVPINPIPDVTANPRALGAAYQQVVEIQTATLQSLGVSYREVQAAGAQFAGRAAVAIDELKADLSQIKSRHDTHVIAAAIRRDRALLSLGHTDVTREEQGLDVARGLADKQANTGKADITNGLFTTLAELVQQNQSTGAAISRSGRRSEHALVRTLNKLGDQLSSTIPIAAKPQ
jgi:hypothetical protein